MIRKELGRTGVYIPEVGIGTWNYHAGPAILRQGLETGALFIDTAESYGTEEVVGKALVGLREHVFVATKISPGNFHAKNVRKSAESSLQRLGVDTIDLLQLHEPNPSIPLGETMGAMAELIDAGWVRFVGVSNFSVAELIEAQKALGHYAIVSNQVRYNLIDRTVEKNLLPYCQNNGITIIAYSPLARGLNRIRDCDTRGVLHSLQRKTGKSPAQIAINWCLCKEGVVAIPKGNTVGHLLENCAASDWRLEPEQLAELEENLEYRLRGKFDSLLRRYTPRGLRKIGLRAMKYLPRALRRRLS
jgi:diketogulonate reductase-like aldo/keto reductase